MEPHGRDNYCCGGGGGLVSIDEIHEFRMTVAGKVKADQIRADRRRASSSRPAPTARSSSRSWSSTTSCPAGSWVCTT